MVLWTEEFATGSDVIDQQHRMLINNINHLESMLTDTNPTREEGEFLAHLVDFLEAYAGTHFKFEEQCMQHYRCPAHTKNKEAHEQFIKFLHQFKERCRTEGMRLDVLRSLHHTLSMWIQDHILRVDTQLKPCIKASKE
jgi:hemerythrin